MFCINASPDRKIQGGSVQYLNIMRKYTVYSHSVLQDLLPFVAKRLDLVREAGRILVASAPEALHNGSQPCQSRRQLGINAVLSGRGRGQRPTDHRNSGAFIGIPVIVVPVLVGIPPVRWFPGWRFLLFPQQSADRYTA